jgi:DNA polymerase V
MEGDISNHERNKEREGASRQNINHSNRLPFHGRDDESDDQLIDLNRQLIRNKPATYIFKMNGDSMNGAGMFSGDTLVVDRSIRNAYGKVVVAVLNGEMIVRRLEKAFNKIRLIPETTKLAPIDVDPYSDFSVWGVVTYVVHAL